MKSHPSLPILFLAALAVGASAQSAENFGPAAKPTTVEPKPDLAASIQVEELDKATESALLAAPSRYAGLDLENYIRGVSSSFSMRTRDIDPFARNQDPNFKPIQPVASKTQVAKFKKEPVIPFSDIVARINITAVMPAQQTFLVGGRSFRIGDRINLDVGKDKLLAIHVMGISSNSVTFRHGITSETSERVLDLMPSGMRRGTDVLPPGVITDNDVPIRALPGTALSSSRR